MTKPIKFAIIGCGRVAGNHLAAILKNDEAELVAVCDINDKRAIAYAKKYNVPHYSDYHKMLENEDTDIVNIITPSGLHAQHAMDILKYKKHVVIEKPMALNVEDIEPMITAYEKIGKNMYIMHQNRFNLPVQKLKELLNKNVLGKISLGTVRLRWCRPQSYYDQDEWRGTWANDGGVLTNQAIHHIDLLQWFLGEVKWVQATIKTQLIDVEVEDTAIVTLEFENGALGVIEATTAARPDDLEASISILAERGSIVIEGTSVNKVMHWDIIDDKMSEEEKTKLTETPPNVYGFGHFHMIDSIVDNLVRNTPIMVDGKEGSKAVKLLSAIYKSAETQSKVYMKDSPISAKLGKGNA